MRRTLKVIIAVLLLLGGAALMVYLYPSIKAIDSALFGSLAMGGAILLCVLAPLGFLAFMFSTSGDKAKK